MGAVIIADAADPGHLAAAGRESYDGTDELQPEMEKPKSAPAMIARSFERVMELYKKEKVNPPRFAHPAADPDLLLALLVIFVTQSCAMRPSSARSRIFGADPTSIFNMFGLLPWSAPIRTASGADLHRILPLLLGISMWLQQKLNPAPTDPAADDLCLVAGCSCSCWADLPLVLLSLDREQRDHLLAVPDHAQPGYTPDLVGNIKGGFKKTPKDAEKKK